MSRPGVEPGTRYLKGSQIAQRPGTEREQVRDFAGIGPALVPLGIAPFPGKWEATGKRLPTEVAGTGTVRRPQASRSAGEPPTGGGPDRAPARWPGRLRGRDGGRLGRADERAAGWREAPAAVPFRD